jgi:pimeloyl-ACP methyl ester carboxylesterase
MLFDTHEIKMIHGTEDPVLPNELLEYELAKLSKQPEVFRIQNCGHMSIWENPDELIQSLKTILV